MHIPTLLAAVGLSTAAAVATTFALRTAADPAPAEAHELLETRRELAELRSSCEQLQRQLSRSLLPLEAAASSTERVDRTAVPAVQPEQVAAAVESYLKQRTGAPSPATPYDARAAFDEARKLRYWDSAEAWKRAHAAGALDELLALFQQAAKAAPNDPEAQLQLGNAYLAYLQQDPTRWQMSTRADSAFDRALELDPNHWEARFTKALSYTFWPDFLGKKPEAMRHFETLLQQQQSLPPEPQHAQTYLYLGNLLEQRGDQDKARKVWQDGAQRHPDNQELRKKLAPR